MLLTLFFLLLLISPVYSDGFDTSRDNIDNRYHHTTGFCTRDLPENCLQNNSIYSLTGLDFRRRMPGIVEKVVGVPGTQIDIYYYYYNNTGHSVDISKIAVPFSRSIISMGNLANILEYPAGEPEYNHINITYYGFTVRKEGMLKEYVGPGVIEAGLDGKYVLDTVVVKNPLVIDEIQMERDGDNANITVELSNMSEQELNEVLFDHDSYSEQFDMLAYGSRVVEYSVPYSTNLGYFEIYNPNSKQECSVYGGDYYDWLQGNSITVLGYRENVGWMSGAYLQPEVEGFCITRQPYSMRSPDLKYERDSEDDNMVEVEEDDIVIGNIEVVSGEVLGVEIKEGSVLPKTGKKIYY